MEKVHIEVKVVKKMVHKINIISMKIITKR